MSRRHNGPITSSSLPTPKAAQQGCPGCSNFLQAACRGPDSVRVSQDSGGPGRGVATQEGRQPDTAAIVPPKWAEVHRHELVPPHRPAEAAPGEGQRRLGSPRPRSVGGSPLDGWDGPMRRIRGDWGVWGGWIGAERERRLLGGWTGAGDEARPGHARCGLSLRDVAGPGVARRRRGRSLWRRSRPRAPTTARSRSAHHSIQRPYPRLHRPRRQLQPQPQPPRPTLQLPPPRPETA